jgi:hypothetical protein
VAPAATTNDSNPNNNDLFIDLSFVEATHVGMARMGSARGKPWGQAKTPAVLMTQPVSLAKIKLWKCADCHIHGSFL